jgi:hypothetical protein
MLILDYLEEIYREGNVYTRIRELLCFLDYLFDYLWTLYEMYAYLAGPHFLEGQGRGGGRQSNTSRGIYYIVPSPSPGF